MVEGFRSGKAGYDSEFWSASNTVPEGVYYEGVGGMAQPDAYIDPVGHSTEVAGIMVGNDSAGAAYRGVGPRAQRHTQGGVL